MTPADNQYVLAGRHLHAVSSATIETKPAVSFWADGIIIDQTMLKSTRGVTRAALGSVTTCKVDDIPPSPIRSKVRELACAGSEMTDSLISHASTGLGPVSIEDFTSTLFGAPVEQGKWQSCLAFCDRRRWFSRLWGAGRLSLPCRVAFSARLSCSVGKACVGEDSMPPFWRTRFVVVWILVWSQGWRLGLAGCADDVAGATDGKPLNLDSQMDRCRIGGSDI